jgi:hypothetical protein
MIRQPDQHGPDAEQARPRSSHLRALSLAGRIRFVVHRVSAFAAAPGATIPPHRQAPDDVLDVSHGRNVQAGVGLRRTGRSNLCCRALGEVCSWLERDPEPRTARLSCLQNVLGRGRKTRRGQG